MVVGAALRLAPIGANRFHQDEALYSFWALQVATGRDPILNHFRVDKPPLFLYTLALCFKLFGPSELAARLPSQLSSMASIGLVYYLASRLYGRTVAMLAAILMTFSPFNILFAPTAFTDPLMVAWALAALCLAARGRLAWSGFMLGLAAATKQQGLLFVPLAIVIGARHRPLAPPPTLRPFGRAQGRPCSGQALGEGSPLPPQNWGGLRGGLREGLFFTLGFLAVMAPVAWWDSLRWQLQPSYLEQSLISYGHLTLVHPAQLVQRLGDWAEILHYITASPILNVLLWGGLPCLLLYDLVRPVSPPNWGGGRGGEPATLFDVLLVAFVILFLLGHWLLSFNIWDRYLLGLVPLLLILLARVIWLASGALAHLLSHSSRPPRSYSVTSSSRLTAKAVILSLKSHPADLGGLTLLRGLLVVGLLSATLAGPAFKAAQSGYPIGGDHGAYDGIETVAAYFRERVPAGSILYHHWLGWHYSFYMFDLPLVLRWYSSPPELAEDAHQEDSAQRYIVFPSGKSTAGVRDDLAEAGLELHRVYWTYSRDGTISFTVYRIEDQK